MGLEKVGLPSKPSAKGTVWTPDSTNCEGCNAVFSLWNRKHHCRRCGGLFCNNCTLQRQVLRGQGDAPVRICNPCKELDDAAKFELRYGKNKAPKGAPKASIKDGTTEAVLKQILRPDGKVHEGEPDVDKILASVADTDSDEHELGSPSQVERDGEKRAPGKHKRQQSDDTFDRVVGEPKEPVSPAKLHEEAQEEKKKYMALRKQGKDAEAMKAFKRAKELERQAEALEKEIKHKRRVSTASSSPLVSQHSEPSPNKGGPDSPDASKGAKKGKAPVRGPAKERRTSAEKDDLLQDLKELGWTDKDIREADKKPAAKSEEQLLAELASEARPKPARAATTAASGPEGPMAMQILAHKRQALALKREGKMGEAKEELKKAKILEKQVEEMALLGHEDREDEASDDDELHALIRGLEREEKLKGDAGKGAASQSIPEDFGFHFNDDDDDAHVEVDEDDLNDPEMVAALRAMGWEEEAAGMERTYKPQPKATRPSQQTPEPSLKDQILARKRKALTLKREGKIAEARAELGEAKKLEQQLEQQLKSAKPVPVVAPQVPEPVFAVGDGKVDEGEEKVEVTDEDMRDPEMMAALRAMGFAEDEPAPILEAIVAVTKPNPVEKATLNQEILALKRQALAMKREGRITEAREELRHAKVLEQQLQDLQAVFQRQEEAPAMIKESRAIRRGAQALPALSGVPSLVDEGEGEDVDVTNADLMDPEIAAALAAVGWQESAEGTPAEDNSKVPEPVPVPELATALPVAEEIQQPQKAETKDSVPIPEERQHQKAETKDVAPVPSAPTKSDPEAAPATPNPLASQKTKSQLQQELLGQKRRALALKREGKSEEARVELREAKVIEEQLKDLEKGPEATPPPPLVVEPKQPPAIATTRSNNEAFEKSSKQDGEAEAARPVYLDDELVEDVDVTEDDMQDPELLATLAGMGWQGEPEAVAPIKPKTPTTVPQEGSAKAPNSKGQTWKQEVKVENLLDFDWGDPIWHPKKPGKDAVDAKSGAHKGAASGSSGKEDKEENPFEGEYGEIGQMVDLAPPQAGAKGPAPPAPKQHRFWHAGFMDLLSGDHYDPAQNKEPKKAPEKGPQKKESTPSHPDYGDDEDVEDAIDPQLIAALKGLGMAPPEAAARKKPTAVSSGGRALPPPVAQKKPDRPPPTPPSSKPAEVPTSQGKESPQLEKPDLKQEILAHKRKALALKREGNAAEAREELRQAKLLERQLETQEGSHGVSTSASMSTPPATGRVNPPPQNKVEEVIVPAGAAAATPSLPEPTNPVKQLSSPTKGPTHKAQMQQQVRQTKDRMKLQQESLAHKRRAMGLRREGRADEADAEYELAKNLEKQMEELDPMHGHEDVGDVPGVEDLLDPQLLAALKGVGFKEGELVGRSEPPPPPRGRLGGAVGAPAGGGGTEQERQQLEEQIRAEKLQAVQLKRAGKQAEALESLRRAKRLEKQLAALCS